jgi:hypothetical protein
MLLSSAAMFGCHDRDKAAVADMEELIHQTLKPGDSAVKIEAFFKDQNLPYDFDRFNQGYQATMTLEGRAIESVVTIYIYVNGDHSFKRAEVRMSYTFL